MLIRIRKLLSSLFSRRRQTSVIRPVAPRRPAARCIEPVESRVMFSAGLLPRPDHTVVVILEDHSYREILGAPFYPSFTWFVALPPAQLQDPYLRSLGSHSAVFTNATATTHYNQSNYQALFSGLAPQRNPHKPLEQNMAPNIASELLAANLTFGGYSEGLPKVGWNKGSSGDYAQAHNPWVDLKNVPASVNLPFSKFPNNLANLPTVSYVVPNEQHNMHSNTVALSDKWMAGNIDRYAKWARTHNSLLVVTWDESHVTSNNIPTIFSGPMVKAGKYGEAINHFQILRTIEDMYGLAPTNQAAVNAPITDVFAQG